MCSVRRSTGLRSLGVLRQKSRDQKGFEKGICGMRNSSMTPRGEVLPVFTHRSPDFVLQLFVRNGRILNLA